MNKSLLVNARKVKRTEAPINTLESKFKYKKTVYGGISLKIA